MRFRFAGAFTTLAVLLFTIVPIDVRAQDVAAVPDTSTYMPEAEYQNQYLGEFSPGSGFDIIRTPRGSLNISVYGLFRYLNQTPANQTYTDHLGRTRKVSARNDINWHRTMIWVSGFFYDPKFRYTITVWGLATTEQTLIFGLLRYVSTKRLTVGAGIGPNLTARSMQGTWPFWASSDRQMAEEFYRGGFATAFFITGEVLPRFYYTASVNRSLSQLGIPASRDNRYYAYSAAVTWLPTTGEFGPRGGFGDLEVHQDAATRFGVSACHSRENRFAPNNEAPAHAQIKLSDGVNPFEAGALADSVVVEDLDYDEIAFDAGLKYKGFSFQAEYAIRQLSNFQATGPLPDDSILDHGLYAQAMYMVVKERVGVYATGGYVFDRFERHPWELSGGASYYPYGNRNLRLNLHYIHIEKSPTGSNFGFYTSGQTGNTVSMGADILF